MRFSFFSASAAALFVFSMLAVPGCAVEEDATEAEDVSDVKTALLTNVGAFELADAKIVAAPAKLKKLLGAMSRPKEGSLRCLPMKTFKIVGKSGRRILSTKKDSDASLGR